MFLIRTRLGQSRIHGVGVMADEPVAAGSVIWRFARGFDLVIPQAGIAALPPAFRDYLDTYAYRSPQVETDAVVLSCDHAKFLNHADSPNTELRGDETLARTDLRPGDEITCDYRLVVAGWTGFG